MHEQVIREALGGYRESVCSVQLAMATLVERWSVVFVFVAHACERCVYGTRRDGRRGGGENNIYDGSHMHARATAQGACMQTAKAWTGVVDSMQHLVHNVEPKAGECTQSFHVIVLY